MATSMLDGGTTVALPRRPLQVRVQPANGVVLEVRTPPSGGTIARHPRPELVVLPTVGAPAVVVARSASGAPFAPDAAISVEVVSGAASSADPERAVLSRVRLGGLMERDLVEVAGDGGRLLVRAAGERVAEADLGPLGNAARAEVAGLLGAAAVPVDEALNVVVAVDRSASFRPRTADGLLDAVLAVLSGVAATLVRDLRIGAALVGDRVEWIGVDAPADLRVALSALPGTRPTSAFASGAPALAGFAPDRNTQVYLVTDGLPGDLDALETASEEDGQGRHLVLLASGSSARAGRSTSVPVTVVEPGPDPLGRLADPRVLRPLVRSLLAGCFAPDGPTAERLRA